MIADTTFISDLLKERRMAKAGDASRFFFKHRAQKIRTSIITAGELAVIFPSSRLAWEFLDSWQIYRLHLGVVDAAADIDREMRRQGRRLGENDNWIAGFARYYREPLISRDQAFDEVPGVRRLAY
jgi:predicted nucleic acid-binding protein